ncbi:hypothetical protein BJ875DRAFT_486977 [Amylocarpus encephaloides]|uniref:Uncharacterized protein n=1 Tax=Amylocarpus encephaloides TaxID=45428 RepID=A0A9P7YD04_9HELO|nr:hypothetical protein BJ875DRAFT_486977 [Amylocarpus encephaloides]
MKFNVAISGATLFISLVSALPAPTGAGSCNETATGNSNIVTFNKRQVSRTFSPTPLPTNLNSTIPANSTAPCNSTIPTSTSIDEPPAFTIFNKRQVAATSLSVTLPVASGFPPKPTNDTTILVPGNNTLPINGTTPSNQTSTVDLTKRVPVAEVEEVKRTWSPLPRSWSASALALLPRTKNGKVEGSWNED